MVLDTTVTCARFDHNFLVVDSSDNTVATIGTSYGSTFIKFTEIDNGDGTYAFQFDVNSDDLADIDQYTVEISGVMPSNSRTYGDAIILDMLDGCLEATLTYS